MSKLQCQLVRLWLVWLYLDILEIWLAMQVQGACLLHNDNSRDESHDAASQDHVEGSVALAVVLLPGPLGDRQVTQPRLVLQGNLGRGLVMGVTIVS